MGATDFYVDYETGTSSFTTDLKAEVERRLLDLAGEHTDLTGAAVSVTPAAKNDAGEPIRYRARVVAYTRPEYLNASKEDDTAVGAVKAALDALERQVREQRGRLGKPWEREDLRTPTPPLDVMADEALADLPPLDAPADIDLDQR